MQNYISPEQNKYAGSTRTFWYKAFAQSNENEKLKGLLLVIVNNFKAKKLSAPESKLWKRAQIALNDLAKHLP